MPPFPISPLKGNPGEIDLEMDSETDPSTGKRKSCFKPPAGGKKGKDKHNDQPVSHEGVSSTVEANSSVESAVPAGGGLGGLAGSVPGGGGSGAGSALAGASAVGGVVGGPAGAVTGLEPGRTKADSDDEEVSLKDISRQMRSMSLNMDTKFENVQSQISNLKGDVHNQLVQLKGDIQTQLSDFKLELARVKEEAVTKVVFESLEARVANLEQVGIQSPEVSWLKDQVNRLDPSNKCIAIKNFGTQSGSERDVCIQKFLEDNLGNPRVQSIEHISGWVDGVRKMTPVSVVEFASRTVREEVLKLAGQKLAYRDNTGAVLAVERAKTALQRKRNTALGKAFDLLKKHGAAKGQKVEISWKIEGLAANEKGLRGVKVNDTLVFRQQVGDVGGVFSSPFEDLQV